MLNYVKASSIISLHNWLCLEMAKRRDTRGKPLHSWSCSLCLLKHLAHTQRKRVASAKRQVGDDWWLHLACLILSLCFNSWGNTTAAGERGLLESNRSRDSQEVFKGKHVPSVTYMWHQKHTALFSPNCTDAQHKPLEAVDSRRTRASSTADVCWNCSWKEVPQGFDSNISIAGMFGLWVDQPLSLPRAPT